MSDAKTGVWHVTMPNSGDQDVALYTVAAADLGEAIRKAWKLDESAKDHANRFQVHAERVDEVTLTEDDLPADTEQALSDRLGALETKVDQLATKALPVEITPKIGP